MILEFQIDEPPAAIPVRAFLKRQGLSSHLWRRLKHQGALFLNGAPVPRAALAVVRAGDRLRCEIPETSSIEPQALPLDIRYEDDALLIVNKPAAMLVHPIAKEPRGTLANAVAHYYRTTGAPCVFHPLHRLDRNTTGLVLIAKQPHIQSLLTSPDGLRFHRIYLAVALGRFDRPRGLIRLPLRRRPGSFIEQEVHKDGKPALTLYRVLAEGPDASLLELRPQTGRTHQLRVHLAAVGHPLLGDDLYGSASAAIARQALHAHHVELIHPVARTPLAVSAPLPGDLARVLQSWPNLRQTEEWSS